MFPISRESESGQKHDDGGADDDLIIVTMSAASFLHHMVRNMVGTLVLVGGGKIPPKEIKNILEAKDRSKSGPNAPAYGLYFYKVEY